MVSQLINVIVNSKGAVTVKRQLDGIGDSAKTTTTYLNSMRAILAAALTFSGASAIVEVADTVTVLQNRLRQVADETTNVGDSWQRLMNIANQSYSTIDSTVNLYFRVAQAYKAWGESAEEAYEFTELFQKSAILSGSSMQTTAQAVYQFSQALNKGKLDGDEFRSVLEGLPYVATLIQKSLGVTRAELYAMSADGKISVDRIKQAFEDAAETIRNDFRNITPTIGMALVVLKNNWTNFISEVQSSTGVFSLIAQGILLIANNFNILAAALAPVGVALAFIAGKLALGLVVNAFKDMAIAITRLIPILTAFNALLWSNPLVLVAALIAGVIAAVVYFREELGLTNEVLLMLWESFKNVFNSLMELLAPIGAAITQVVASFRDWLMSFEAVRRIVSITAADIGNMFRSVMNSIKTVAAYLMDAFGPIFESLFELFKELGGLIMEIAGLYADLWVPVIREVWELYKQWWSFLEPVMVALIQFLGDVFQGWANIANYLKVTFMPVIRDVFEGWIKIINGVINVVRTLISALQTALRLMRLTGDQKGGGGGGKGAPGANYGLQGYAGEFATGGGFKVGGTGNGRDTTPVSFRANRGERVTVETKKQQRQADAAQQGAPSVNVPVTVTNIFDPNMIPAAMETASGQRAFLNLIAANRDEVTSILGVR